MKRNIKKWSTALISIFLCLSLTNVAYSVIWPVKGTYPKEIESDYGPRYVKKGTKFHKALDFAGHKEIRAVEKGIVEKIYLSGEPYYIKIIGKHTVFYLHMGTVTIKEKDTVNEGQKIGEYRMADKHVDVRLNKLSGDTNPLRDLFSPLYTGSAPSIPENKFKLDVEEKEGYNLKKKGGD
jgi:hypothetical protein